MGRSRPQRVLTALAGVVVAAACGGSGDEPLGGTWRQTPVSFTPSEGGICRGQPFAWEVEFVDGAMEADIVDGGCGSEEGVRWRFERVEDG